MKQLTKKLPKNKTRKLHRKYRSIGSCIKNSGTIIFVIVIGIGLVAALLDLNTMLQYTYGGEDSNSTTQTVQLDQSTVNKLSQLHSSSDNSVESSTSSKNPFAQAD